MLIMLQLCLAGAHAFGGSHLTLLRVVYNCLMELVAHLLYYKQESMFFVSLHPIHFPLKSRAGSELDCTLGMLPNLDICTTGIYALYIRCTVCAINIATFVLPLHCLPHGLDLIKNHKNEDCL